MFGRHPRLPPGVTPSDIPGNRPEDVEYDKVVGELSEKHPDWSGEKVRKTAKEILERRATVETIDETLSFDRKGLSLEKKKKMKADREKAKKDLDRLWKEGVKSITEDLI